MYTAPPLDKSLAKFLLYVRRKPLMTIIKKIKKIKKIRIKKPNKGFLWVLLFSYPLFYISALSVEI